MYCKRRPAELTTAQKIKMQEAAQKKKEQRRKLDAETLAMSDNLNCRVCGRRFMTGFICRRYKGSICERHCQECQYFQRQFWQCLYRDNEGDE